MESEEEAPKKDRSLPLVNFRPLLFCALGISFGVFLYCRIRFGGLLPSDFLLLLCFLPLAAAPLTKKRLIAMLVCLCVFAAAGVIGIHIYTENFLSGKRAGSYTVEGTVTVINVQDGYTEAELDGLVLNGESVGGKLAVSVTGERLRTGDRIVFSANIARNPLPTGVSDSYEFVNDIRYRADIEAYEEGERGFHPLLSLNAKIFDAATEQMGGEEGYISYALLTGNSRMVDSGFMTAVRRGGIAHIFAVSGLHIGILFGAVLLVCRPFLRRWAALPALALSTVYCALCGFTVSSLRALIMCIFLSLNGLLGRKTDMLTSISLAAVGVLLFLPAQWLSVGFRLSFGACLGLALFSSSLSALFRKIHLPQFLGDYLSASLSVQLFTFPIMLEAFGYFSVWGLALNLVIVPLLPLAFLTLLLCMLLSLIIPPAAGFFLIFPKGLFSALLFLFAAEDFGWALTGFAVGAAGVVWLTGCILCTQRVRLHPAVRVFATCFAVLLFSLCLVAENCLFGGAVIDTYEHGEGMLALVRTEESSVLILDGDLSLADCKDFLSRHTGHIDAAVVLSEEQTRAVNIAAFTGAERVYCLRDKEDGLRETDVVCGKTFAEGELAFSYEADNTLMLFVRGLTVKFEFGEVSALRADLCIEKGCGTLKYFLDYDIILLL